MSNVLGVIHKCEWGFQEGWYLPHMPPMDKLPLKISVHIFTCIIRFVYFFTHKPFSKSGTWFYTDKQ